MDKDLVKVFVRECINEQNFKIKHKANYVEMCDYFKYSGETEEYKEEYKWEKNKPKYKEVIYNNPIIKFYFKNSNYTIKKIAKKMKIGEGTVRAVISNYFNNKKLENGKNIKDGECK